MSSIPANSFRRREVLFVLSTVMVMVIMGMNIMVPVLPLYAQSFGVTSTMVGMVIASFGLARILMDLPSGQWSERFGRRPFIIAGPAIVAVASFLCGLAPNLWLLILFRFIQGLGSAFYATTAMAVLTDISTAEDRGRVMSLFQGTLLFGSGLGPTVGGVVAQAYGMRAPFFTSALLGLMATLWALWRIPETRGMVQATDLEKQAPSEAEGVEAGSLWSLLSNTNFLLAGLIGFAIFYTFAGARQTIIPLLGYSQLGLSEVQIGFALTIISVIDFLVIFFGGVIADRFGRKVVIVPSVAVTAISLILFALGDSYAFFLFSAGVFGIGRGLAGAAPTAFAADIAPKGSYGLASGLYRTFCDVGFVLGPITMGWIADAADFAWALYANAGLLFLSALLFTMLAQERVRKPHPEAILPEAEV